MKKLVDKFGRKKLVIAGVVIVIVIIAAIVGGVLFWKSSNNRGMTGREMPQMPGMGEDVIAASGLTATGMMEEKYELDFLETALYVEESYLSIGDTVEAGEAVFKVSDETLKQAREELEKAATEADLAYRQGVISYETQKLEAESTHAQAEINKEYAQAEYDSALEQAKKEVDTLTTQVEEAQELYDEYKAVVESDYYYTYYKVEELRQIYYENFTYLMELYEKWNIDELEDQYPNVSSGTSGSSSSSSSIGSGTSGISGGSSTVPTGTGSGISSGGSTVSFVQLSAVVGTENEDTGDGETFVSAVGNTIDDNSNTDDTAGSTGDDGSQADDTTGNIGDAGSNTDDTTGNTGDDDNGTDDTTGNTGDDDNSTDDTDDNTGDDGSGTGQDNENTTGGGDDEGNGGSGMPSGSMPSGGMSGGGMAGGGKSGGGSFYDENSGKLSVYQMMDELVQKNGEEYETALENYEQNTKTATASLESARSQLAKLQAELAEAQLEYEKQVIAQKATYETTIAESENAELVYDTEIKKLDEELEALKDEKEETEENLALFEETIGDGYFYTASAGTVVMNMVRAGNYLSGDSMLLAYSDPNTVTVAASVAQEDIAQIAVGDSAYVMISEYGNYEGTVISINPVSSSDSRSSVTYTVTVELSGEIEGLESNLTAYVYFGMTEEMMQRGNGNQPGEGMGPGGEGQPGEGAMPEGGEQSGEGMMPSGEGQPGEGAMPEGGEQSGEGMMPGGRGQSDESTMPQMQNGQEMDGRPEEMKQDE